jgi:hypothetical protein
VEDDIAVGLDQLDLLVRSFCRGFRYEIDVESFVDVRFDRVAGDDAALAQPSLQPPARADHVALPLKGRMRLQPVDRRQAEPVRNLQALPLVGGEVDALAIANLIERKPVGKVFRHGIFPSERSSRPVSAKRRHRDRSADSLCLAAPGLGSSSR